MNFFGALVFGIIFLCLGGVCGCACCIALGKCFKKHYSPAYFTVLCVLLSFCVAAAALGLILLPELNAQIDGFFKNLIFFVCLFFAGFLSSSLWRIFLGLFLLIYVILSIYTGIKLYGKFGTSLDSVEVSVFQNRISIGGESIFIDSENQKGIVVEVFELPPILLLPLPRVWYSVIGIVDLKSESYQNQNIRKLPSFSALASAKEKNEDANSAEKIKSRFRFAEFFVEKENDFMNWVLKNRKNLIVEIPGDVIPVIYNLDFTSKGEILNCKLNKVL